MRTIVIAVLATGLLIAAPIGVRAFLRARHSTHPGYVAGGWLCILGHAAMSLVRAAYDVVGHIPAPETIVTAHGFSEPLAYVAAMFLFHHSGRMLGRTERMFL